MTKADIPLLDDALADLRRICETSNPPQSVISGICEALDAGRLFNFVGVVKGGIRAGDLPSGVYASSLLIGLIVACRASDWDSAIDIITKAKTGMPPSCKAISHA